MLPIETKEFFSRLTAADGPDRELYESLLTEMRRVAAAYIPKELRHHISLTEVVAAGVEDGILKLRETTSTGQFPDDRIKFLNLVRTIVRRRAISRFRKATAERRNPAKEIHNASVIDNVAGGPDPANQLAAKELLDLIATELEQIEPPARRLACFLTLIGQMKVADTTKSLQAYEASLRDTDLQAAEAFQCCKSPNTIASWVKQAVEMIKEKFGPLYL